MKDVIYDLKTLYKKEFKKKISEIESDKYLESINRLMTDVTLDEMKFLNSREFKVPNVGKVEVLKNVRNDYDTNTVTLRNIKTICLKYDMKFLPVSYYKGVISSDVVKAITEFESTKDASVLHYGRYFILAQKEAFGIKKRITNTSFILFFVENVNIYMTYGISPGDVEKNKKATIVKEFNKNIMLSNRIRGFFKMHMFLIESIIWTFTVLLFFTSIYFAIQAKNSHAVGNHYLLFYIVGVLLSFLLPIISYETFLYKYRGYPTPEYMNYWNEMDIEINGRPL